MRTEITPGQDSDYIKQGSSVSYIFPSVDF